MLATGSITPIVDLTRRSLPIDGLIVTATSSGAAQTLFTTPEPGVTTITRLTVTNTTGTAATLTLHAIVSGGSIGQVNEELDAFNVPANTTLRIDELMGAVYAPGTEIKVFSGTNGSLTVRGGATQER